MELGLAIEALRPEGLDPDGFVISLAAVVLTGIATGLYLRTGALIVLTYLCFFPVLLAGLIIGWPFLQTLAVAFFLLAALQAGFVAGAGASVLHACLRKRFAGTPHIRSVSRRDPL